MKPSREIGLLDRRWLSFFNHLTGAAEVFKYSTGSVTAAITCGVLHVASDLNQ
jgi:hypothetical protein